MKKYITITLICLISFGILQACDTSKEREVYTEIVDGKEMKYVPGELLIQLYPDKINLSTEEGIQKLEEFVTAKSAELTPIIIEKLTASVKLKADEINEEYKEKLKTSLITYERRFGSANGGVLIIAIDNAAVEISEELQKDEVVEGATPNYVGEWH